VEIGISTFAELTGGSAGTKPPTAGERLLEVVEEAVLADTLGLDVYAVGEHHRPDFAPPARPSCSPR
jgi:alkanesulfonate monooxygenase SsuD/methylene tetrahydromethanopterin reductase-like flavin-dependent oxidoreductase (luciferase family)